MKIIRLLLLIQLFFSTPILVDTPVNTPKDSTSDFYLMTDAQ